MASECDRTMEEPEQIQVLVAEDDEDHVLLLERALRKFPRPVTLHVARDGQEALDLLRRGSERPGLILLDLNMPKLTGLEVLREVKGDPALAAIPTVVLTTSARDEDRAASFAGGADDFVTKPVNFRRFAQTLLELLERYFTPGSEGETSPNPG